MNASSNWQMSKQHHPTSFSNDVIDNIARGKNHFIDGATDKKVLFLQSTFLCTVTANYKEIPVDNSVILNNGVSIIKKSIQLFVEEKL